MTELSELSGEPPNKEIMAGVSFNRPLTQTEIDRIVAQHHLKLDYFEYVATNNVSGVASAIAYPSLEKAQEGLTHGTIIGMTYILAFGMASEFDKLNQQNDNVILADVGFFVEIEEARREVGIAWESLPDNLYQEYDRLGRNENNRAATSE